MLHRITAISLLIYNLCYFKCIINYFLNIFHKSILFHVPIYNLRSFNYTHSCINFLIKSIYFETIFLSLIIRNAKKVFKYCTTNGLSYNVRLDRFSSMFILSRPYKNH